MADLVFECLLEIHCVPSHIAFHTQGAVYQGGICPHCGKLVQGKFLKNAWTEETETENVLLLRGFDISDLEEQGYIVFSLEAMQAARDLGKLQEMGYPDPKSYT